MCAILCSLVRTQPFQSFQRITRSVLLLIAFTLPDHLFIQIVQFVSQALRLKLILLLLCVRLNGIENVRQILAQTNLSLLSYLE